MKVLDLQCSLGHSFEGWFASEGDFQRQIARGLLECPLCSDRAVARVPSAPRLNLGAASSTDAAPSRSGATGGGACSADAVTLPSTALQAAWLRMVRRVMAQTEDVGERFAEEARRIHYGETGERAIRGQATREQTQQLLDEGIAVMPLPIPAGLKDPLQ